jgi:transposase
LFAAGTMKKIDVAAQAHRLRKVDFRRGSKLGYLDQVDEYRKPHRPDWMSKKEYTKYPDVIRIRHLRYKVHHKGYRNREVTLATTLLDAEAYTAEDLASLYGRRWSVELHILSLKTQMTMEHLRYQSPSMVRKEIHCHLLLPALRPGEIVIMDNLSSHKSSRIIDKIHSAGVEVLFLPPYSPDLNPIEQIFAKIKAILCRFGARTERRLYNAISKAIVIVTASDCLNCFSNSGYVAQ